MAVTREVVEGRQAQGEDEEVVYTITSTPWGSSPTTPTMVVKDLSAGGADVTSSVTSGSMSVAGDVITLKTIKDLSAGSIYRVEVKFTSGSNVFEPYFLIDAET